MENALYGFTRLSVVYFSSYNIVSVNYIIAAVADAAAVAVAAVAVAAPLGLTKSRAWSARCGVHCITGFWKKSIAH